MQLGSTYPGIKVVRDISHHVTKELEDLGGNAMNLRASSSEYDSSSSGSASSSEDAVEPPQVFRYADRLGSKST